MLIFEALNSRYTGELKKDPEKIATFFYSKFSPLSDCINQEKKVSLKEILCLVQTNLIKMYVELS